MNHTHLKTFLAVVEEHSITRGAKRAHVSQSTASLHVRELESEVGAVLLDRRLGGIALTPAGEVMVTYARRLTALSQEAIRHVRAEGNGTIPCLRVFACHVAAGSFAERVDRLQATVPDLEFSVRVGTMDEAMDQLRDGAFHVALVRGPVAGPGFDVVEYHQVEFGLVAAPGVDPEHGRVPPVALVSGRGTEGLTPEGVTPWLTADDPDAVLRWVLRGSAMAFLPLSAAAEDLAAGRLRVVPWPGTPVRCDLVAAWPQEGRAHPKAARFASALAAAWAHP